MLREGATVRWGNKMLVVMNVRDASATEWDRFWFGVIDRDVPLERFGFRMWVLDVRKDMPRIEERCKEIVEE